MLVVRPILNKDLDELYTLSGLAQAGLTSLPQDREILRRKIHQSERSFQEICDKPGAEIYLFVAEDPKTGKAVGTTAIYAKVGGYEPFYSYKIRTVTSASKVLKVKVAARYLELLVNHNGPTEIGTLLLSPDYRQSGSGRLLSVSRFLFMAEYPQCFEDEVIAEMRGVIDDNDRSPFWEALGKHFFAVEFKNADMMTLRDKSFIAELMPKNPIYISLLPKEAQDVIGKVHPSTEPALHILEREGFVYDEEIDIFEAGPLIRAKRETIRAVRDSESAEVAGVADRSPDGPPMAMASGSFDSFRAIIGTVQKTSNGIIISRSSAEALKTEKGGRVRFVPLKPSQ